MNKAFPFLNRLFDAQNWLMNRCKGLILVQHAIQCYHFITFIAASCSSITTRRWLVHSNWWCTIRVDSKQINKARDTQNLFGLYTGIIIINVLTNERKVCIGLGFTGAMYNCTDILCPRMFDITLAESLVIHKYS